MTVKKPKHFGRILIEKGIITQEDLQEALLSQKSLKLRLGEIIVRKGLATEEDIIAALSEHYNIPYQMTIPFDDPKNLFSQIPIHFLKNNKLAPFRMEKSTIFVALYDALNIRPLDDLKMLFPEYNFEPVMTTENEIQRLIQTHYDTMNAETTGDFIDDLEDADLEILSSQASEAEDILDMANEAPIIRLVNMILKQAVNDRSSDIHIEPYEKDLVVRFRIDGILYEMFTPPKKFQNAITSRIKIMANLNIAENRLPQDGRIQIKIGAKDIDIRVSVFPTYYGERVVLRLLNKTDMEFNLSALGFEQKILENFDAQIKKSHGIILVTGPTGSGKTTTLYCVLSQLNKPQVNILTVEDPIEYQIKGIGQMQVKSKIDLTFANGLRSILRQDPDIIMVGEIRDVETAEIAVQSALTGHLVLSTLHTNDAASGITRLIDMGIEPFLISSSVNAFLAQRLVRVICPHCKETYKPTPKILAELNLKPSQLKGGKLTRGKGCEKCLNTGYLGRTGIYELLPVTNEIRRLIMEQADAGIIKEMAVKHGMITLFQDGLKKAIDGETTIEEILRVS